MSLLGCTFDVFERDVFANEPCAKADVQVGLGDFGLEAPKCNGEGCGYDGADSNQECVYGFVHAPEQEWECTERPHNPSNPNATALVMQINARRLLLAPLARFPAHFAFPRWRLLLCAW